MHIGLSGYQVSDVLGNSDSFHFTGVLAQRKGKRCIRYVAIRYVAIRYVAYNVL